MNKKELAGKVAELLRTNDVRKPVSIRKHTFHVSDDDGNAADFVVKRTDRNVLYTIDDAINIIDACLEVIENAIRTGERVSIHGFGTFGVSYRAARRTKQPGTEDWYDVEERYIPKFSYGNDLRTAAMVYGLNLKDKYNGPDYDCFDEEDEDGDDV